MRAVYEATHAVPELGIEPGDTVYIDDRDDDCPLRIVKHLDRYQLPKILTHVDSFILHRLSGVPSDSHRVNALPLERREGRRRFLRVL